ncbi:CBS domain-containing protein [Chitinophaga oryzae]|uniref:CBS domain-containing protein n=1 Tax=Chitinophaga oryzae TaxID=2725414 RepID=A0AAE6ZLY1_9BACT|nr:CBS domain-containing protein [Chitinophaga oryzae]QJB34150.1 CBS domain-containing protein [Chitinophaga oryzae]QJB40670.1 CBS domain-containing protein [Chitinophaga oryzae]
MTARELISTVPILQPSDAGAKALRLMNEYHLTQLPMVVENKYMALVEEDQIMDLEEPEIKLESIHYNGANRTAIQEGAHLFEALKLFHEFKLSVLPVITKENDYLGIITKDNLLAALAQYNGAKEAGGILALEMEPRDYSLSEIARIAESNDVTLLSVNTLTDPSGKLEVLLKTNRQELHSLVATYERFNYTIKYIYSEEQEEDLLKKNYDLLMNYISM